ncbi:MAG: sulfatase [Pirellulaceae bacterium]|nr:MAG: sulfatase [Pirellulaceae bacterium]
MAHCTCTQGNRPQEACLSRRHLLRRIGMGMGSVALLPILAEDCPAAVNPLAPKAPHFPGKAKHVIHLFMNGGPSHVDTFDPKPELNKRHGQDLPNGNLRTERPTGAAFGSPFKFRKFGQSGIEVSELFEHVAQSIDDMVVIRSMHADVPNHEPSLLLMNCGEARLIRPSVGSWVTYGLGTENQNLPAFVVMCPGGYPIQESQNWQAGFLPGIYQGTYIDTKHTSVERLIENITNHRIDTAEQRRQLDLLAEINRRHAATRDEDPQLEARIQAYELAFRMQMEAAEVFDISREPQYILDMYGPGVQGRQMLIARRLIERGVRFVQVWHGAGQPWDSHDDLEINHRRLARECDQAIGALLKDLKQRGLLEETLVIWGGEFGRTPTVELPKKGSNQGKINGRDHNHYGFTMWLAGGGVKGGTVYGATDEFGFRAVENPVHVHDLHATILYLLGFDHEKFTYRYAGRDFRLTDVHGRVVHELIA